MPKDPAPQDEPVVEALVEDDRFGEISVRLDVVRGEVVVAGERVPRIEIRRAEGAEMEEHIPVGTRDGALLTLTVDGADAVIEPAEGRLTRRSFRVDVWYGEHSWRLVPNSTGDSGLFRDATEHIGDFSSEGDGKVVGEWREDAEPDALDAAFGYALAAAFGTGAESTWLLTAGAVGDFFV
ncbi:hypothetical protein [Streptomyces adelaidensis]|uniref:hypothetical protein n=1 Tax=Streptomyces adelaidensis TaxID=2796465 RepID=UPI0019052CD9|nr:hypothetical protein [Streptomyces adelaidensis]